VVSSDLKSNSFTLIILFNSSIEREASGEPSQFEGGMG